VSDLETKTIRGQTALELALDMRSQGFNPDLIVAHPGWGESLFLKQVWPKARLALYCELYYRARGADTGFDPEFAQAAAPEQEGARILLKNANNLLHLETADAGLSPTQWQASTFPERFRPTITVVHDGIDTSLIKPQPSVNLALKTQDGQHVKLQRGDEVPTYVARQLEPYRGYHRFMRALPELLKRRPHLRVLIVGGNGVSYGAPPPAGTSWKEVFAQEVKPQISPQDWQRVHFLGSLPYAQYLAVLQLSSVHVYLTYPFVLSWSLMEAMSAGCAIVASNTAPVQEVIEDGTHGLLVDFFDTPGLTDRICSLLDSPSERERLGSAARMRVVADYDLHSQCLPRQLKWVDSLLQG
jgi:glycosyltransferase involved in cell wall biosynthesis